MNWDHGPLSTEEHQNMQRGYEVALEAAKDEFARMDLSVGFDHAEHWLKERGIQFDRELESHKRLALELMIKHVKLLEIDIERHKGDYSSKMEKELLEEINGPTTNVQWIQPPPPAKPVHTSDTFKEAADDYWEEYSINLKPRSQLDYKG